jgi:LPS-assembly lipoprotein
MSWFETSPMSGSWRTTTWPSLLLLLLALAACGFQPLYGRDSETGVAANDELARVMVLPIRQRTGQQMHNLLRDRLNPLGQPVEPSYTLSVKLIERITELGIQQDATATRAQLTMVAEYALRDMSGETVLYSGRARSANSYDILEDPYATQVSEFDARERTLETLSDTMKIRLATFFNRAPE